MLARDESAKHWHYNAASKNRGVDTQRLTEVGRLAPFRAVCVTCWSDKGYEKPKKSPLFNAAEVGLVRYAGLSQRSVADLLLIGSGSAVINQLRRLAGALADSRQLQRQVEKAEALLEKTKQSKATRQLQK